MDPPFFAGLTRRTLLEADPEAAAEADDFEPGTRREQPPEDPEEEGTMTGGELWQCAVGTVSIRLKRVKF